MLLKWSELVFMKKKKEQEQEPESSPLRESELEEKASGYEEQLKRLQAEFENYKKRTDREKLESIRLANKAFVNELVSLDEAFEQGLSHMEGANPEEVKKGVSLIRENLQALLRKEGVEMISPKKGDRFDFNLHEAVMTQDSDECGDDCVLETVKKGYKIGPTVIKPAMVVVCKK